jgi:hypothetical protein
MDLAAFSDFVNKTGVPVAITIVAMYFSLPILKAISRLVAKKVSGESTKTDPPPSRRPGPDDESDNGKRKRTTTAGSGSSSFTPTRSAAEQPNLMSHSMFATFSRIITIEIPLIDFRCPARTDLIRDASTTILSSFSDAMRNFLTKHENAVYGTQVSGYTHAASVEKMITEWQGNLCTTWREAGMPDDVVTVLYRWSSPRIAKSVGYAVAMAKSPHFSTNYHRTAAAMSMMEANLDMAIVGMIDGILTMNGRLDGQEYHGRKFVHYTELLYDKLDEACAQKQHETKVNLSPVQPVHATPPPLTQHSPN